MSLLTIEQQVFIDDDNQYKSLQGVAGSRKTNALIHSAIRSLRQGKNVLFLTKIGSVTREILSRVSRDFGYQFLKKASHYLHSANANEATLCIANFDGAVDTNLRHNKIAFDGDAFTSKIKLLSAHADQTSAFVMKTGELVDEIVIDEIQDLTSLQMEMVVKLLKQHSRIRLSVAGDQLQMLFQESIDKEKKFALSYLNDFQLSQHYLTVCFRCPKAHVDFINITMGRYYHQYNLPLIKSNNTDMSNKPVIFQHSPSTNEVSRYYIAKQLTIIVKHVLENDPDIQPGDICVLMNKTNVNAVFEQCICELNHFYMDHFIDSLPYSKVQHMKTKNSEGRITLDWSQATDKTSFSSIHAVKGLAFKCVIVLGMSEKSIPLAEWLFKPEEVISQSAFNVSCSRSTRYLFIGVNTIPSRYIMEELDALKEQEAVYLSWDKSTIKNAPNFYKALLENFKHYEPVKFIDRYSVKPQDTPTKSVLAVKGDIVQEDHISDHINNAFSIMDNLKHKEFGSRFRTSDSLCGEQRGIFGHLAELMFQHYVAIQRNDDKLESDVLKNYRDKSIPILYTHNQRILALVHEFKMNDAVKKRDFWFDQKAMLMRTSKSRPIRDWIALIAKPTYIIDEAFKNTNLRETIDMYFSCKNLTSTKWWDLAVFITSVSGDHRVISVNKMLGFFKGDLTILHENIAIFYDKYVLKHIVKDTKIKFQTDLLVKKKIVLDESLSNKLRDVGFPAEHETYQYGFYGISDMVILNANSNTLIEIKAISESSGSKLKQWVFQCLIYVYLLKKLSGISISYIEIVNLYSGRIWSIKIADIRIKYRDMIGSILRQRDFPEELIEYFLENK